MVAFPEEKIRYEVATMRFVAANTSIPVPKVYHYGTAAENPSGLGPFIIMEYIDHHQNMSRELLDPLRPAHEPPVLNPDIKKDKLEYLYSQMANILLQLSSLKFPRIGSLVEGNKQETSSVFVRGRPITTNLNDILIHTGTPKSIIPSDACDSTNDWYKTLAYMHAAQLAFQHNDAIEDENDVRDKYVARHLFRRLANEGDLAPALHDAQDGFMLFSEDFRPANVLLDKNLRIVGVIDWEFAYAAPAQFSYDPPWWLLLEEPESWRGGYRDWMEAYEPRLQTFLRVLEAEERNMADQSVEQKMSNVSLTNKVLLSPRMRESWEKKHWLINYAARKSWAFDFIWWKFWMRLFWT
jgi:aminoglycoside phosphotransferase (APT) family kinase protein